MAITMRGNTFHLRRRVPKRYQGVDDRGTVYASLHTDSLREAKIKAEAMWTHLIEGWEAMLAGDTADAQRRFDAARELAANRGHRYLTAARVAELPREELLARVEATIGRDGEPDDRLADALLGGVPEPQTTVSNALDLYWGLAADKTLGKSDDQLRRWKNPRIKAVKNFIDVVGDKALSEITADDTLAFRDWWMGRIRAGEVTANSANKDLTHLGDVLKTVVKMKRLGIALPLSDLSFKEGEAGQRPPFSTEWIRDRLLAKGALDGLNPDARRIVLAMVNTGARPSELAGLTAETIHLDHDVPFISIEPTGRQLKTKNARRRIPLVGVSLEAMKAAPRGFPRYRTNSAGLSGTVNKFLRENGLLETPGHSLYGLRHSFEDRLLAADIDERVRRDLFGHALNRERYGDGLALPALRDLLQRVAL